MKYTLLLLGLLAVVYAGKHLFRRADENQDHKLSPAEFYTIFDHWDNDGDGKISINEFTQGWLRDDWDNEEDRFADFHLFDVNDDNYITDDPDLHHLFRVFDTNNSSFVSEHEFDKGWDRFFD